MEYDSLFTFSRCLRDHPEGLQLCYRAKAHGYYNVFRKTKQFAIIYNMPYVRCVTCGKLIFSESTRQALLHYIPHNIEKIMLDYPEKRLAIDYAHISLDHPPVNLHDGSLLNVFERYNGGL